jgi:hypothetical protein
MNDLEAWDALPLRASWTGFHWDLAVVQTPSGFIGFPDDVEARRGTSGEHARPAVSYVTGVINGAEIVPVPKWPWGGCGLPLFYVPHRIGRSEHALVFPTSAGQVVLSSSSDLIAPSQPGAEPIRTLAAGLPHITIPADDSCLAALAEHARRTEAGFAMNAAAYRRVAGEAAGADRMTDLAAAVRYAAENAGHYSPESVDRHWVLGALAEATRQRQQPSGSFRPRPPFDPAWTWTGPVAGKQPVGRPRRVASRTGEGKARGAPR